ncbi:MAG TPA: hypothetical protein VLI21_16885 [Casimicrobiaceae bacterium]|nr:hypothetical protein [Casimicrobiaceae bacterium]
MSSAETADAGSNGAIPATGTVVSPPIGTNAHLEGTPSSSSSPSAGKATRAAKAPTGPSTVTGSARAPRRAKVARSEPTKDMQARSTTRPAKEIDASTATERLIARDLAKFSPSLSKEPLPVDRDAMETQRLVDRDLGSFRDKSAPRSPDRAFPEIN